MAISFPKKINKNFPQLPLFQNKSFFCGSTRLFSLQFAWSTFIGSGFFFLLSTVHSENPNEFIRKPLLVCKHHSKINFLASFCCFDANLMEMQIRD